MIKRVNKLAAEHFIQDLDTNYTINSNEMFRKYQYGQWAEPDEQGDEPVCVLFSASKAVVNGLMKQKWLPNQFDVDQATVKNVLVNHLITTLRESTQSGCQGS